jgi:hypothetical protein
MKFRMMAAGALVAAGLVAAGGAGYAKPTSSPTVTLYANVDQHGDLGSHSGATKVVAHTLGTIFATYTVIFNRPIGNCAASAQPGYAGGHLTAGWFTSQVTANDDNDNAFNVSFGRPGQLGETLNVPSAFMITVTCPT